MKFVRNLKCKTLKETVKRQIKLQVCKFVLLHPYNICTTCFKQTAAIAAEKTGTVAEAAAAAAVAAAAAAAAGVREVFSAG